MTVVLLINRLSVSTSYITRPLASSTRVVFNGESVVNTSFMAIAFCGSNARAGGLRGLVAVQWRTRGEKELVLIPTSDASCCAVDPELNLETFLGLRIFEEPSGTRGNHQAAADCRSRVTCRCFTSLLKKGMLECCGNPAQPCPDTALNSPAHTT